MTWLRKVYYLLFCFIVLTSGSVVKAQRDSIHLIQVSGVTLMSNEGHELPFVNIKNMTRNGGVSSMHSGVYAIVAQPGDSIRYSFVGFRPEYYVVPNIPGNFLVHNQLLLMDTFYLPESIVKPLPSKETFEYQFVYQDINDDLWAVARNNTEYNQLRFISSVLMKDAGENQSVSQKQYIDRFINYNQVPENTLLSPAAWMKFLETLKK